MDPAPIQLGPFTVLGKIGEGGMGVVYKARDTRLDRTVAIKLLPDGKLADADRRARFIQEAKAASALNHPNIVTIHEINEDAGRTYIVMEFIDGKPLNELIPRSGMKLLDGLRIAVQAADALTAAHAANIVHRDLKPGNIMVDGNGRVKILDFGLAKLAAKPLAATDETLTIGAALTEEGVIVGSAPYMSPEQAEGKQVDARSDIFSFGSVLYELFSGKRAFAAESRVSTLAAVVEKNPAPLGEAVPPELEKLIARCMRKDLAKRSQHISDVKFA
ncbi:MAG: serine/threonine protein kinase, partial [Gammaproteobacteria bacterium]|nr:serine/threonine protein kinase [Gammaproteobacteria bacterium]